MYKVSKYIHICTCITWCSNTSYYTFFPLFLICIILILGGGCFLCNAGLFPWEWGNIPPTYLYGYIFIVHIICTLKQHKLPSSSNLLLHHFTYPTFFFSHIVVFPVQGAKGKSPTFAPSSPCPLFFFSLLSFLISLLFHTFISPTPLYSPGTETPPRAF